MNLYLIGHDYRYAAEQMLLTLFPDERPVYPDGRPTGDRAELRLMSGAKVTTATCVLVYQGRTANGRTSVPNEELTDPNETDRRLQGAVKRAFYRAAMGIGLPHRPWGMLTGVRPGKLMTPLLAQGMGDVQAARYFERHYDVAPARAALVVRTAHATLRAMDSLGEKDVCLYVGIPFCPTRCAYCSFVSQSVEKSMALVPEFLQALAREIAATAEAVHRAGLRVVSLYIGGGTPTTLSARQLDALCTQLDAAFDLSALREFTVEAGRPDTITADKLHVLRAHRVDRISVNPQTLDDRVLETIGRRHTAQDIYDALQLVRTTGGFAVNMDLIAGLPGDTVESFERSLRQAIALDPENITVHTLTLKRASRIVIEDQKENDYADVAAMLEKCRLLAEAGYRPYYLYRQKNTLQNLENVGWCKPGHEGYYNIYIMEEVQTILSAGAGGSTKLVADGGKRMQRIFNFKYPNEYIQRFAEVLERKKGVADFYDHDLGTQTSG